MEKSATITVSELQEKLERSGKKYFYIPDYQRGYRWDKERVKTLLDDLDGFKGTKPGEDEIYMLQPLVIAPSSDGEGYNVVDGQQRLTTILLIWNYLSKSDKKYTLKYQRETGAQTTLDDIISKPLEKLGEVKNQNIDAFHMCQVRETIDEWFKDKAQDYKNGFLDILKNRVSFIWYDINEYGGEEGEVFTRLNIGKIPLTDSELIKGLILNKKNYKKDPENVVKEKKIRIAAEWDKIEYALQNDEFWLFVHNLDKNLKDEYAKYPTRIEFLLDIIAKGDRLGIKAEKFEDRATYRYFDEALKSNIYSESAELIWEKIVEIFQILDEWYNDPVMFNYVGYLITVSGDDDKTMILDLLDSWNAMNKEDFVYKNTVGKESKSLKFRIREVLAKNVKWIDKWDEYEFDEEGSRPKSDCKDLLLLHNVETVVRQNGYFANNQKYNLPYFKRFAFHLYKKERWEVEHIRPNSGDKFTHGEKPLTEHIRLYLDLAGRTITDNDLLREIDDMKMAMDRNDFDKDKFEKLYSKIMDLDNGIDDSDKNKIWNFTLLDENTNTVYSNYIFPVKRVYLLKKEIGEKIDPRKAAGSMNAGAAIATSIQPMVPYIPPCTKNVFTKFYTENPQSLIEWTEDDANAYLDNMRTILQDFLP